jgi:assimilatory nitrate reductase electron transfer subunit
MRRVVIIGYGMAGSRLVEGIRRRDPCGERVHVTVVGDEKHPPYNRTLLSTVVTGLPSDAISLPGNDVVPRFGAVALDRSRRTVILKDRSTVDFDVAVLATGARAWLPPVDGLTEPGVTLYRTLDDCVRIRDMARSQAPVAVLGGGLLGIEVACALAECGNQVTVVHPAGHLMERQLDAGAADVLTKVLARLGIEVVVGCPATRHEPGRGLELITGDHVRADHVVVTAGVRPETALARHAGLAVDRGVLVDDTLRSTYPRVHAIGDCAQHPGAVSGHARPAWDQADVLADLLTETDSAARYHGTPTVARLNARAVDLVVLGTAARAAFATPDVLCLTEFSPHHYTKLVVRDDRIEGAIVLGAPEMAATVTRFYEQGLPVTADLRALLLGGTTARRWETADI